MIHFGMANSPFQFDGKYYAYEYTAGHMDPRDRGLTIGGFESSLLADLVIAYVLDDMVSVSVLVLVKNMVFAFNALWSPTGRHASPTIRPFGRLRVRRPTAPTIASPVTKALSVVGHQPPLSMTHQTGLPLIWGPSISNG